MIIGEIRDIHDKERFAYFKACNSHACNFVKEKIN
jgi:hypothetical protein